jgi:serine/threonine-protein kinase HipA
MMSKMLDVYLHNSLVGQLEHDQHGQISFAYSTAWLENPGAVPLSQSLPLEPELRVGRECQGFFGGILPEEKNRELVAKILGISARNDFAMLNELGGECAGAVSFLPTGSPPSDQNHVYQPLAEDELASILEELPNRPLLAGKKDIRLSSRKWINRSPRAAGSATIRRRNCCRTFRKPSGA